MHTTEAILRTVDKPYIYNKPFMNAIPAHLGPKFGWIALLGVLVFLCLHPFRMQVAFANGLLNEYGQIENADDFVDHCPSSLPGFPFELNIRRDGVLVDKTKIPCTEPVSSMPLSNITDELHYSLLFGVFDSIDAGMSGHLLWTPGSLRDYVTSRIKGVNIDSSIPAGTPAYCCTSFNDGLYVNMHPSYPDDVVKKFLRSWEGLSNSEALLIHEVRHLDNQHHDCANNRKDSNFNLDNLSANGVQWFTTYLNLTGGINTGVSCLSSERSQVIAQRFLTDLDYYSNNFCVTKPPVITLPSHPFGPCVGGSVEGFVNGFAGSLENILVTVFDATNESLIRGTVFSDASGKFRAPRLDGDYKLFASSGDECFVPQWYPQKNNFIDASVLSFIGDMVLPVNLSLDEALIKAPSMSAPAARQGVPVTYTFQRADQNQSNPIIYVVDWGDGHREELAPSVNSISKVWDKAGTYNVSVQTRCLEHLVESQPANYSVTVGYPNGPDLQVSWLKIPTESCRSTRQGQKCTIKGTVQVTNVGNAKSVPGTVYFVKSVDNAYGSDDAIVKQRSVARLNPSKARSINFSYAEPLGQSWKDRYLIVSVDSADINDENNIIVSGPL